MSKQLAAAKPCIAIAANSILPLIEACEAMYNALLVINMTSKDQDHLAWSFEAIEKATEILLGKDGGGEDG